MVSTRVRWDYTLGHKPPDLIDRCNGSMAKSCSHLRVATTLAEVTTRERLSVALNGRIERETDFLTLVTLLGLTLQVVLSMEWYIRTTSAEANLLAIFTIFLEISNIELRTRNRMKKTICRSLSRIPSRHSANLRLWCLLSRYSTNRVDGMCESRVWAYYCGCIRRKTYYCEDPENCKPNKVWIDLNHECSRTKCPQNMVSNLKSRN